jgi:hypothetical protein
MVNNYSNINKTNIYFSPSFTAYNIENRCPALGQAQQCGGVTPVNGIQAPPLLITGYSNGNTYKKNDKNIHRFAPV